jgi:hypothetical protein
MNIWKNLQKKDAQRAYEVDIKQPLKTPSKLLPNKRPPKNASKAVYIIPNIHHKKNN